MAGHGADPPKRVPPGPRKAGLREMLTGGRPRRIGFLFRAEGNRQKYPQLSQGSAPTRVVRAGTMQKTFLKWCLQPLSQTGRSPALFEGSFLMGSTYAEKMEVGEHQATASSRDLHRRLKEERLGKRGSEGKARQEQRPNLGGSGPRGCIGLRVGTPQRDREKSPGKKCSMRSKVKEESVARRVFLVETTGHRNDKKNSKPKSLPGGRKRGLNVHPLEKITETGWGKTRGLQEKGNGRIIRNGVDTR